MVAAASLIQASHAVYYGFSTLDWRAAGLDGTTIGALWALGVVAEIALFALSGRLPAWISPTVLLAIGGPGRRCAGARWRSIRRCGCCRRCKACTDCRSARRTSAASAFSLPRRRPAAAATVQGVLAVVLGLVMAAAMAASGQLYAMFGTQAYGAMAVLGAAGGVIALLANRTRPA